MNGEKPWYLSKGVIGGVVAFGAGIAGLLGVTIGPDEQATLTESAIALVTALSGLLAVYGRVKADSKIK